MIRNLKRTFTAFLAAVMTLAIIVPSVDAAPLRSLVRTYVAMKVVGKTVRAARTARVMTRATTVRRYLREIQTVTGHKVTKQQFSQIKRCLNGSMPGCLNPANASASSWKNAKKDVIAAWEKDTGKQWNRYASSVPGRGSVPQAPAGQRWDGHHIIPKEFGGPHQSWNIIPAPKPTHRAILHRGM